jgi:hypothetical protein
MKTLALALLLLASAARADIREIKSMAEIIPSLDTSTLLVLDIDNTLLEPVGNVGSDQWYYYLVKAARRDGLPDGNADAAWSVALKTVKVKPVEALTPGLVRAQQERGVTVMGLTARGPEDELDTLRQFREAGLDLTVRPATMGRMVLRKAELGSEQDGVFSSGVMLMGDGDKGKALLRFLKKIGLKPARVVFVDDKLKNVKNVDAALTAARVPVVSFRYGATDAKVQAFNDVMAEADTRKNACLLFHGIFQPMYTESGVPTTAPPGVK